jgi:hypothetical protein
VKRSHAESLIEQIENILSADKDEFGDHLYRTKLRYLGPVCDVIVERTTGMTDDQAIELGVTILELLKVPEGSVDLDTEQITGNNFRIVIT